TRLGEQGAVPSCVGGLDPDERRAGGSRVDGERGRVEGVAGARKLRARGCDRAARGRAGGRVPRSARAGRGSARDTRGGARALAPGVAGRPEELIVYGGSGRAARSHEALRAIVGALLELGADETLLVQSGKPVGIFTTHEHAPRVLIANSLLVPKWATWDEFRRLEAEGLTMFGQMTAGSWIYIGTQGILQGTYQTFAAAGERQFGSPDLSGRTILTAGLGGM